MFRNIYKGKKVFVTGHTGFKGSWLCAWLLNLGADVCGFSNDIPTDPSHFDVLDLGKNMRHEIGDVRDREHLMKVIQDFGPDMVFHLAAQPLVRCSYDDPALTFETNALGTMNVLECMRQNPQIRVGVIITSDKCYRNMEWERGYHEEDILGGEDPYSASKGCAELIVYSYTRSFFCHEDSPAVASVRAGNVIGGGDWAENRIVPDAVKAWAKKNTVALRSPKATRPWQHVLEPLSGYLWLGCRLWQKEATLKGESFNFGPDETFEKSVEELVKSMLRYWPDAQYCVQQNKEVDKKEATLLKLSCTKALALLDWRTILSFDEVVSLTTQWYQTFYHKAPSSAQELTYTQIALYEEKAKEKGMLWAQS